jgi:predicted permease
MILELARSPEPRTDPMQELKNDLRYALRSLAKSPSFTLVALLTLTLGIGATTAIASMVESLLLGSLPFADADRLVYLEEHHPQGGRFEVSFLDFLDWKKEAKSFTGLAAYSFQGYEDAAMVVEGEPETVRTSLISPELLLLLGLRPLLGRGFTEAESTVGGDQVALLSHRLWKRRFHGDPQAVGRAVQVNGKTFAIVGVLPPGRQFPFEAELFLPVSRLSEAERESRTFHVVGVIGRLAPGVSIDGARSEMSALAGRLQQAYPESNGGIGTHVVPLQEQLVGSLRPTLLALVGAVALVLLIACANVANLLLVRGIARERELALRTTLGAGRGRLVRQLLTESLLLTLASTLLGIGLAAAALPLLRSEVARLAGPQLTGVDTATLSVPVLLLTAALAIVTGLVFGLLPARGASRLNLTAALRQGERGGTGKGGKARAILATSEIALAVAILLAAALLLESFSNLLRVDPGFDTKGVLSLHVSLPATLYPDTPEIQKFYEDFLGRVAAIPGVTAVASTNLRPLSPSNSTTRFLVEGAPQPEPGNFPVTQIRFVSPSYFDTLGIRLLGGRQFEAKDLETTSTGVAIVNQTFARRYLPRNHAVDSQIVLGVVTANPNHFPVVGVVEDVHDLSLAGEVEPEIYFPGFINRANVLVRGAGDPLALAPAVQKAALSIDRNQPIYQVEALQSVLSASLARPRLLAFLLGLFALLALGLAALGIYGVLAYSVAQRRREIGVRMALGAQRPQVLGMILRQGALMILAGEAVGLAVALGFGRYLESLLFEVEAADLSAIVGSLAVLALVSLAAVAVPAWRAARVDPIETLRVE